MCMSSKATAVSVVRNAKAVEKEAPLLLRGMRELSAVNLGRAESKLHEIIRGWGMTLPLDITYFNQGLLFAPMLTISTWFEYLLECRSPLLLGGLDKTDPMAGRLLESFWAAYRHEHPEHEVFQGDIPCSRCIPLCLYSDEGRGLRKTPVQVVGFETMFGLETAKACTKLAASGTTSDEALWQAMAHTGRGSSLNSRILLYVLPHKAYKGAKKEFWFRVMNYAMADFARLCERGISSQGLLWRPALIAVKGDAPALAKMGRFTRSFQHWQGTAGICHLCLAGRPEHSWEKVASDSSWTQTLFAERPWKPRLPSCVLQVPFCQTAPERAFRSDCMHLVKLGIARHFIASSIVALGEWDAFPGATESMAALLSLAHDDFAWSAKFELRQTPHLKVFSKDGLHWPRRTSYPWGGLLAAAHQACTSVHASA